MKDMEGLKKRVLIIGYGSFIGTALSKYLKQKRGIKSAHLMFWGLILK